LTYRSFFCGENLVAVASIVRWARFDLKWAWSENFCARFARIHIFSPPNLQYLPTPMGLSKRIVDLQCLLQGSELPETQQTIPKQSLSIETNCLHYSDCSEALEL